MFSESLIFGVVTHKKTVPDKDWLEREGRVTGRGAYCEVIICRASRGRRIGWSEGL